MMLTCLSFTFYIRILPYHTVVHDLDQYVGYPMIVIALFPILSALSMSRTTSFLSPFSHLGNITLFASVATVCAYAVTRSPYGISFDALYHLQPYTNLRGLAIFVGISAFSVCAHAEMLAIEEDAANRKQFPRLVTSVMSLITISYALFGIAIAAA